MRVLDGKAAIVTGAGSGLGEAYARGLAACGAEVLATDVNEETVQGVAASVVAAGGVAVAHVGSVAVAADAAATVRACMEAFGKVDVLVNNAGIFHVAPVWEEDEDRFRALIEVNLVGTFHMAREVIPHMKDRGRGSIVNVVSGALAGIWGSSAYGATKAGVAAFTYAWALELAPFGVRVNAISPRGRTSSSVLDTRWDPDVNVPMTVFLASDASATVTGQILRIEGETVSLFSHPRPVNHVVAPSGWTVDLVQEIFPTTIGRHLEPVGLGVPQYRYYEGLESAPLPVDPRGRPSAS